MARIDDVSDAILQATLIRDAPRWDGRLFLDALDNPATSPLTLAPTPAALAAAKAALDDVPSTPSPTTGYPAQPDGTNETDNRKAITEAALHRLSQRLGSALWQKDIGINRTAFYRGEITNDQVLDICTDALRADADWYTVIDASWSLIPSRPRELVVTLIGTAETDPAPIYVRFEVLQ